MTNTPATSKSPAKPSLGLTDFGVSNSGTLVVKKVDKYGSIGKAGVVEGDEIVAINNTRVPTVPAEVQAFINRTVEAVGVGGQLTVRIARQGQAQDLAVTIKAKKSLSLELEEVSEVLERKIAPAVQ